MISSIFFFFFLATPGTLSLKLRTDDKWPVKFVQNAQTTPTVHITLDPPEDPLPQVSAVIETLENKRLKYEEESIQKLEEIFNTQLEVSNKEITSAIKEALLIFDSPAIKAATIKGILLPLISPKKANILWQGYMEAPSSALSLLQLQENQTDITKSPSINVRVAPIDEIDVSIKKAIELLESSNNKQEILSIEQIQSEMSLLLPITLKVLKKALSVLLNQYQVNQSDLDATQAYVKSLVKSKKEYKNTVPSSTQIADTSSLLQINSFRSPIKAHDMMGLGFEQEKGEDSPLLLVGEVSVEIHAINDGKDGIKPESGRDMRDRFDGEDKTKENLLFLSRGTTALGEQRQAYPEHSVDQRAPRFALSQGAVAAGGELRSSSPRERNGSEFLSPLASRAAYKNTIMSAMEERLRGLRHSSLSLPPVQLPTAILDKGAPPSTPFPKPRGVIPSPESVYEPSREADEEMEDETKEEETLTEEDIEKLRGELLEAINRFFDFGKSSSHSFLQTKAADLFELGSSSVNLNNQLNVRVSTANESYPTVDELVFEMSSRRNTSERLFRLRSLELFVKLMSAQHDMIREGLGVGVKAIIARLGPLINTLRAKVLETSMQERLLERGRLFKDDYELKKYIDMKAEAYSKQYFKAMNELEK